MKWYDCLNRSFSCTEALQMYKEARAPRDYKREYAQYHSKPQRVAERSQRNQARRIMGLKKGDPREVDHKNPISNGGSNSRSNLRAVSLVENRKKFTKTANDRERTYAEMRDAIRGFAAKQKIDPEKAMLVAGGAGYMHGMRDEVNDLDFFHDDLPDFVQEPYGRFDMDGGPGKDLPPAAKQYQMMHGMRVQTPESMLAFYQRLNRPKDQEKIKMLKAHLKTASDHVRHTIVTGHSGSGKSTLSRKLSKETGLPIYAMDDDPGIRDAFFNYQKTYAKNHDGRLDLSPERRALEDEIERRGIRKALELEAPHIIEGSHFLRRKPEEFKKHKLIMVNPSAETIAFQRTNRKKLRDLARGRDWNPEIERKSKFRGQQLYDMYEEGGRADNWRKSSLVEKRAAATATKTDPAKWEAAKREAKAKMGGKHSARAMQLATQIYKKKGGGYSGAKPTSKNNSLKKWTKQKWGYSGKDKPGQGGSGVYLPKRRRDALKATKQGRKMLASATRKKHKATRSGRQYSSHGLAAGTSLEKKAIDPRLTLWLMDKAKKSKSPTAKKILNKASDASHTLATGAWDMYADKPSTRTGRMFKASLSSAKDVVDGTNPAMATTHAKLKFVGDSGIGSQVVDAGRSVANAGKAMAENSNTLTGKAKGRVLQGAGNIASAGGWWQGNMPDWLPGLW